MSSSSSSPVTLSLLLLLTTATTTIIYFRARKRKITCQIPNLILKILTKNNSHEFHDAVIALNKVTFGGHDWIAEAFPHWVENTDTNHVLGIFDVRNHNQLVSLEVLRRYSDTIGCVEALRVHPDVRGKGLSHEMQRCLLEYAHVHTPLELLTYTTYNKNVKSIKVATQSRFKPHQRFCYVMIAEQEYQDGEDTLWMTFKATPLKKYREKVTSIIPPFTLQHSQSQLREIKDGRFITKLIMTETQTKVMLLSWKPVFVQDLFKETLPMGKHQVLLSDVGISIGSINNAGARVQYISRRTARSVDMVQSLTITERQQLLFEFYDVLIHLQEWLQKTIDKNTNGCWFAYPEEFHPFMVEYGLDLEDMKYEMLLTYEIKR
jgi:RimJ/RimL family protein N-acetyltransferase